MLRLSMPMPYNVAIQSVKKMIKSSSNNIYIGVESLFEKSMAVVLEGMWPTYVTRRHALIKSESGFLQKWKKL